MKQWSRHAQEGGFALVVSLMILVILTLLGVSMFTNVGLQQRMAGNLREKHKAFQAAQTALAYGEWWLAQNETSATPSQGVTCTGPTATPQVCSNALPTPTSVPWNYGTTYQAPESQQLVVSPSGGVNTYHGAPVFYIQFYATDTVQGGTLYRVTAWARGGNANSVAVVQSLYLVGAGGGNSTRATTLGGSGS